MRKLLFYCLTVASVLATSCQTLLNDRPNPPLDIPTVELAISLERGYESASGDSQSLENKINSLSAYLFKGQDLVEVFDGLTGDADSLKFKYEADKKTHVYFIANAEKLPHVRQITAGSIKWSDFMKLRSSDKVSVKPEFLTMSGSVDLTSAESKKYVIRVNRGMSRVDLLINNSKIAINKVTICNTQNEGFIFSQDNVDQPTYSNLELNFATPATSNIPELTYINEQRNEQLYALVECTYNGMDAKLNLKLPNNIVRNSTCQITIDAPDAIVVGSVRVVDWSAGDDQPATPDTYFDIKIDDNQSQIPAGASLSLTTNTVNFSKKGGEATLWFTGNFDKDVQVTSADSRVVITPINTIYRNAAIKITATQIAGFDTCLVKIKVSKAYVPSDVSLELTVSMVGLEIEHVVMGGLKWMMVNGIGQDARLYPSLEEGQTARDFYKKHWKDHTAMTVWGPRPTDSQLPQLWPWHSATTTDIGGGAIAGDGVVSWLPVHGNLPCPKGWRLPTIDECKRIWPTGSASATYVINGVSYTSSIENSGHPAFMLDGTTTTAPTKIFVISDGKQDLIFPIAGWRRAGLTTPVHADEIGIYLNLWVMNRGANGISAPTIGVRNGAAHLSSGGGAVDWVLTDAYKNLRCVKDL